MLFYLKQWVWISLFATIWQNVAFSQNEPLKNRSVEGNSNSDEETTQPFERSFPAMGTLVHLVVFSDNSQLASDAFDRAEQLVAELAAKLTDYDPASETRQLTEGSSSGPTKVSDPVWHVIQAADAWYRRSDGALDCSLGSLTSLWRKYRRVDRIPPAAAVESARQNTGWQNVGMNAEERTVQLSNDRIRLDFGAIGKGYIADRIYELLQQYDLYSCLVNISGNMRCGNPPPDRAYWRIAVSPLEPNGQPVRKMGVTNTAIATSGDLWQYSVIEGQKRSHVLDPRTGYGVPGPLSVTVVAPCALDADALATIGCVMDWPEFVELLQSYEKTHALRAAYVDEKLQVLQTDGFPSDSLAPASLPRLQ